VREMARLPSTRNTTSSAGFAPRTRAEIPSFEALAIAGLRRLTSPAFEIRRPAPATSFGFARAPLEVREGPRGPSLAPPPPLSG